MEHAGPQSVGATRLDALKWIG